MTLAAAEELALAAEPGHAALSARAEALRERAAAAARLPDPSLRAGIINFPIESGGFATEAMTQGQLGLRQAFPPGDSLAADARRYESLAAAMAQSADGRRRDVRAAVRSAWLSVRYWTEARDIVTESRPFFTDLVTVTRSLYAVGRKDQQDVLRAGLELSRLDDRLLGVESRLAEARAALSEWVGDAARRPLAPLDRDLAILPSAAALQGALDDHPALAAADAEIAARRAAVELEEERYKPGWAVDLAYGYRDGRLPGGAPRSDFVSVSVTVDLPFLGRQRRDSSLAAALGERRAATNAREQVRRQLRARLDSALARWRELGRRLELYDRQILEQTEDRARAALAAYQSETGDFADVMRGRIDELDARLERARLQYERAETWTVLASLGGIDR
ncbi:MAG: TolC family protein [Woeseiaceae bacterium]|nr:TolC family protein [Woeseiaceae bacterium]